MIYTYGVSLPGTDHIKKDISCQDSHKIICKGSDVAIAAVADGVGSAKYSDVGSRLAVERAVGLCGAHITSEMPPDEILKIIKSGFAAALKAVEHEAASNEHSADQYDTTLTLAVLVHDNLYYGHSGDGGIIALAVDGRYMQVTQQQQDSSGRVYPLFFQDMWEFGVYEKKVAAVLLATDGMYEPFFPIYIKNDDVNIHVQLAQSFMDYRKLDLESLGQEAALERMTKYLENIPAEQVSDDKTIVVLINTSVRTCDQPESYYTPPNWAELKRRHDDEWRRSAYPDMYNVPEEKKAELPEPEKKTELQAFEESLPVDMTFRRGVMTKLCKNCGSNMPAASTFCKKCGAKMPVETPYNMPQMYPQAEPVYNAPQPAMYVAHEHSFFKRAFFVMMGINVVLVIAIAVLIAFWLLQSARDEDAQANGLRADNGSQEQDLPSIGTDRQETEEPEVNGEIQEDEPVEDDEAIYEIDQEDGEPPDDTEVRIPYSVYLGDGFSVSYLFGSKTFYHRGRVVAVIPGMSDHEVWKRFLEENYDRIERRFYRD